MPLSPDIFIGQAYVRTRARAMASRPAKKGRKSMVQWIFHRWCAAEKTMPTLPGHGQGRRYHAMNKRRTGNRNLICVR